MKTIILVRHAKAEEKTTPDRDFNRILNKKGIGDAGKLGKWLKSNITLPDCIISSPAARAFQTAEIVQREIRFPGIVSTDEKIYCDSADDLIDVIKKLPEKYRNVMIVGHNPSFNELMHYLCDTGIDNIPKAAAAAIQVSEKWREISQKCGRMLFLEKPR
ncbi:MAG: histidine phosphatase family protein [Bacteroidetes bacterium]|nr:histidine phosphatase family protein [Bacteroidota bacterium]